MIEYIFRKGPMYIFIVLITLFAQDLCAKKVEKQVKPTTQEQIPTWQESNSREWFTESPTVKEIMEKGLNPRYKDLGSPQQNIQERGHLASEMSNLLFSMNGLATRYINPLPVLRMLPSEIVRDAQLFVQYYQDEEVDLNNKQEVKKQIKNMQYAFDRAQIKFNILNERIDLNLPLEVVEDRGNADSSHRGFNVRLLISAIKNALEDRTDFIQYNPEKYLALLEKIKNILNKVQEFYQEEPINEEDMLAQERQIADFTDEIKRYQ